MGKYKITDFSIGDEVYHLSNTKLFMVVIEVNKDTNEVSCEWTDKNGSHFKEYMAEVLGKKDDLRGRITYGSV